MQRVEALVDEGRFDEAISCLKALPAEVLAEPDNADLLARGYQGLGNVVWTRRTLEGILSSSPNDCRLRAWLVWVLLSQGNYREADGVLDEAVAGRSLGENRDGAWGGAKGSGTEPGENRGRSLGWCDRGEPCRGRALAVGGGGILVARRMPGDGAGRGSLDLA